MKPSEPSPTARVIARHRAAHQVLDHGSTPLLTHCAMKVLREDEGNGRASDSPGNGNPLASIGRLFTTARSRIAEDASLKSCCKRCVPGGSLSPLVSAPKPS